MLEMRHDLEDVGQEFVIGYLRQPAATESALILGLSFALEYTENQESPVKHSRSKLMILSMLVDTPSAVGGK